MLDKQGSLAQNVTPVFTVKDINAKTMELSSVCHPIMNKPAPKVKKETPPPSSEGEPEPMDTDEKKNGKSKPDGATEDMEVDG